MQRKRLIEKLKDRTVFVVIAELSAGHGFNFGPIEGFLTGYSVGGDANIPSAFDFAAVTAPQNPSGQANIAPADVLGRIEALDLLGQLDFIPHITCAGQNSDVLISSLIAFKNADVRCVLALTGDKPKTGGGLFELDSIGLLQLIKRFNNDSYIKAVPDQLESVHQFSAGAAVSPFKYTEASQMQQYYKAEKKIRSGAQFLITQVGWDWKKSAELFRYFDENHLNVPIIGNVYLLTTRTAAARMMHDLKLPGCFVSDRLLEKLYCEGVEAHIERAAQQVAMYKGLGAAGVDISGVSDFETFTRILGRAAEIGAGWKRFQDNLCWPPPNGFYLYTGNGRARALSRPRKKLRQRFFNLTHRLLLDTNHKGFCAFRRSMEAFGLKKGKGIIYRVFTAAEKAVKYLIFDCKACGDCSLPENFGQCTIGGCEKSMSNAPCGDATVEGYCGNNLQRVCIGELIYNAAAAEKGGIERLRSTISKPRDRSLENTSSVLNYLFGKDRTMKNLLLSIGEAIHASIPKTGRVMKQLVERGADAYSAASGPLNYIRALIESQAADGADYIAVNLDAFGESGPQVAVDMMVEYVRMVRRWGGGVPVCIDSSSDDVLIAGLKQWYDTGKNVKPPLLNSVKFYTMDSILPLRSDYEFAFVGLLVGEDKPTGPGGSHSVDELYSFARQIFDAAVRKYGFKPQEIFFDSTVFPLAIDMPMEPNVPGYTYRAFETIKKIKSDPDMAGVHCSLGISNCCRDLPGRKVGICRAYVAKALEYGLDAGIVNISHHYGSVEPAPELLELVDAFTKMDGSAERQNRAMELMGKFCRQTRKPAE